MAKMCWLCFLSHQLKRIQDELMTDMITHEGMNKWI